MLNKKRWISIFLVAIVFAGSLLAFPKEAWACSCAESGSVQENKSRSDAVFEGTAASVKPSSLSLFGSPAKAVKASFHVNEVWKGHVAPSIEVLTAGSGETCGYEFQEGERYLVYATATGNSLEVSLCSGTILTSEANEQMTLLGSGSLPPQSGFANKQTSAYPRSLYLSIGAVVAIALAFFLYRKRKQPISKT